MLRADMNTIMAFLKDVKRTNSQLTRGVVLGDTAGFGALTGPEGAVNKANLERAGCILGIPVHRLASMADGYLDYFDMGPTTPVAIRTSILVSDSGSFSVSTYTDTGKCGVFAGGGGETVHIIGDRVNNGTFLTSSANADTMVVTATFVTEADAPMINISM